MISGLIGYYRGPISAIVSGPQSSFDNINNDDNNDGVINGIDNPLEKTDAQPVEFKNPPPENVEEIFETEQIVTEESKDIIDTTEIPAKPPADDFDIFLS